MRPEVPIFSDEKKQVRTIYHSHPAMLETSTHSIANTASSSCPRDVRPTSVGSVQDVSIPRDEDDFHPTILRPSPVRTHAATYRAEFQSLVWGVRSTRAAHNGGALVVAATCPSRRESSSPTVNARQTGRADGPAMARGFPNSPPWQPYPPWSGCHR